MRGIVSRAGFMQQTEYYMIDEFRGAERVLIKASNEVTSEFVRSWCKISPVGKVHVYGPLFSLKRIRSMVMAMAKAKTDPLYFQCTWLDKDALEIKKITQSDYYAK